jgi:hypothetical protein
VSAKAVRKALSKVMNQKGIFKNKMESMCFKTR